MRAICPNNREHKEFITTASIIQEWKVDERGEFICATDDCLSITNGPDKDNTWSCATCGEYAILKGEIVTLYATVLEGDEDSYLDVYGAEDEEEAKALIGTYYDDDLKIVGVKKGYSVAPKGQKMLYDGAPDFCNSYEEARAAAERLGLDLY